MTDRNKSEPLAKRFKGPNPESSIAVTGLFRPAAPESRLLSHAEALQQILEYVTQQAKACKFAELGLLAEKAHANAIELVREIKQETFGKN